MHSPSLQSVNGAADLNGVDVTLGLAPLLRTKRPMYPAEMQEPELAEDHELISKMHHYSKVALGTYGSSIIRLAMSGEMPTFKSVKEAMKHEAQRLQGATARSKWFETELKVICDFLDIEWSCVSISHLEAKPFRPAHIVYCDHKRRAVTVTIRGTLSIADVLTDIAQEPVPIVFPPIKPDDDVYYGRKPKKESKRFRDMVRQFLDPEYRGQRERDKATEEVKGREREREREESEVSERDGEKQEERERELQTSHRYPNIEWQAHWGMLASASMLYYDLLPYLGALLEAYPGYNLVCVGHSLGSGVASLLALLLREVYPSTTCYGVGTPCIASYALCREMASFCTNCVFQYDMFSRLSVHNTIGLAVDLENHAGVVKFSLRNTFNRLASHIKGRKVAQSEPIKPKRVTSSTLPAIKEGGVSDTEPLASGYIDSASILVKEEVEESEGETEGEREREIASEGEGERQREREREAEHRNLARRSSVTGLEYLPVPPPPPLMRRYTITQPVSNHSSDMDHMDGQAFSRAVKEVQLANATAAQMVLRSQVPLTSPLSLFPPGDLYHICFALPGVDSWLGMYKYQKGREAMVKKRAKQDTKKRQRELEAHGVVRRTSLERERDRERERERQREESTSECRQEQSESEQSASESVTYTSASSKALLSFLNGTPRFRVYRIDQGHLATMKPHTMKPHEEMLLHHLHTSYFFGLGSVYRRVCGKGARKGE
ncbi:hypothetical protein KIPB_002383 [Kipferlia bialata]|uniref:sn-1-specific diacylglycerol lipase n=1 Tax=Kipferlia bialata TaxID=797122 RepID=A0A9K3CS67_9EUKA|nr:hypothetical protein KIPB_002383 [Kipferlia bialata]|eukprot:g2383.t1